MSGFPICKSGELWPSLHAPHPPRLQGRQEGAPDQVWLCLAFFPPLSFYHWFFFLFLRSPCSSTTPQRWWLMLTSHCCQNPNSWGQHVTWEQAGPLGLAGGEAQFQLSTLQHPLMTPPTPSGRGPPTGGEQPFPPALGLGVPWSFVQHGVSGLSRRSGRREGTEAPRGAPQAVKLPSGPQSRHPCSCSLTQKRVSSYDTAECTELVRVVSLSFANPHTRVPCPIRTEAGGRGQRPGAPAGPSQPAFLSLRPLF